VRREEEKKKNDEEKERRKEKLNDTGRKSRKDEGEKKGNWSWHVLTPTR
jgi:hypothetical protein